MQNKTVKNKNRITETEMNADSSNNGVSSQNKGMSPTGSRDSTQSVKYNSNSTASRSSAENKNDSSYNDYINKKNEYEKTKSLLPEDYDAGDYSKKLNMLADKILNRKEFAYDYTTDENYLAYLKSYRDSGLESAKKALASSARMSAGYGNSYAFNSAQTAYEQYMSKASDKIPQMYSDAYSRYKDEEESLYNKYGLLSDEESKNYSRYRDEVSDKKYDISLAYRDMTDAAENYYKDRDYAHTLERERISDKRYETEYSDKLKQQSFENNLSERKYRSDLEQKKTENDLAERKYQSDLSQRQIENDLNERKYQSDLSQRQIENDLNERKYKSDLNQKKIENDLNERKFFESVIHQDYEDDLSERKYQSDLEQKRTENDLAERKYQSDLAQKKIENDLAKRKFDDQVEEEIADSYRYEIDNSMKQRQWRYDYELNKEKLEETKKQNEADNAYRNKSLEYSKQNNDRNYDLSVRKANSSDEQWLKEYNEKMREFDENMIYKKYFS